MAKKTVLLTVDALRQDYFSPEYFPNSWDTFSKHFSIFSNCHSHGTATPLAFPGLITGDLPDGDGSLNKDSVTLGELYEGRTIAHPNNPHLNSGRGYNRGISEFQPEESTYLSRIKSIAGQFDIVSHVYDITMDKFGSSGMCPYTRAESLSSRIIDDLETSLDFLWAHYMDPHAPHTPSTLPDGDFPNSGNYYDDLSDRLHEEEASESDILEFERLYGRHVRYLDRHLSRVLDKLKTTPWWEDALVVFVGDHGEAFGESGEYLHPWEGDPIECVTNTPLAVKFPDQTTGKFDYLVKHSDIHSEIVTHATGNAAADEHALRTPSRMVVTKSNTSIRILSEDGQAIRRQDGTQATEGLVTDEMQDQLEDLSFPIVSLQSGDIPGGKQTNSVHNRLEALGYK